ncbi:hypothetical protein F504_4578 (plasmid) [Ralstonia pseudosolanacearum FQY_4]|nr:hypothetical protein F504_4578 [Ralstonia pseudosolanacearum FQY_4]
MIRRGTPRPVSVPPNRHAAPRRTTPRGIRLNLNRCGRGSCTH